MTEDEAISLASDMLVYVALMELFEQMPASRMENPEAVRLTGFLNAVNVRMRENGVIIGPVQKGIS